MSLTIRPIEPSEWETLGEITVASYLASGFLTANSGYADYLRDVGARAESGTVLVALDSTEIVGGISVVPPGSKKAEVALPGEAEIRALAVAPTAGKSGVGTRLAERAVTTAFDELGATAIALCSKDTMHAAHHIYRKIGFNRAPHRDWAPLPDIRLLTFTLDPASYRPTSLDE
ncbi:GNAT family N-acetyltransferase [Haloglycomyces albus]|uniref:GNAT family N-acetyltransferase n=1 Tax=Haloglycomyces albus TaxID=526067 RepID=UPI00046CE054|nr:GNAT family N-acetyltransferase [Haloglycomyces albus]